MIIIDNVNFSEAELIKYGIGLIKRRGNKIIKDIKGRKIDAATYRSYKVSGSERTKHMDPKGWYRDEDKVNKLLDEESKELAELIRSNKNIRKRNRKLGKVIQGDLVYKDDLNYKKLFHEIGHNEEELYSKSGLFKDLIKHKNYNKDLDVYLSELEASIRGAIELVSSNKADRFDLLKYKNDMIGVLNTYRNHRLPSGEIYDRIHYRSILLMNKYVDLLIKKYLPL